MESGLGHWVGPDSILADLVVMRCGDGADIRQPSKNGNPQFLCERGSELSIHPKHRLQVFITI